jgi:hypothetical protein
MSSCGIFEVDLWIKGKKFTHPVNVIQELKENISGIEFIHSHRLTYDIIACQVKFATPEQTLSTWMKTTSAASFWKTALLMMSP